MTHNLDLIHIRDLRLRCIIGINPEEREKKQDVIINITLSADLRQACQSDCIEDTIDYKKIKNGIVSMAGASSFFLVERLAEGIAEICLRDSRVLEARVLIEKPGALRFTRTVGVEITRCQAAG